YSVDGFGNLTHIDSQITGDSAQKVTGDGTYVYVADNYGGARTYSVDGSGFLTEVDVDDNTGRALEVWSDGQFLYVANGSGIHSFYTDNVGSTIFIDKLTTGGRASDVWGDGNFVYVATYDEGIQSYSVNGAGEFTYIDSETLGQDIRNVSGDENYVYTADYADGVRSYSVDGSGNLTYIDSHDPGGVFRDVWADDGYVYLVGYDLDVYSVNGSGHLTHLAEYDSLTGGQSVYGDDRFVYMGTDLSGIRVYEKGDSGSLTYKSTYSGWYNDTLWSDGKLLYMCGRDDDLQTFTVSDSGVLSRVDWEGYGTCYGVGGNGTYVYGANSLEGIITYSISSQVDEWVPSDIPVDQYVASGVQQSTTTSWNTVGEKRFLVLTQDNIGWRSVWIPHTITISESDTLPVAGISLPNVGSFSSPINLVGTFSDVDGDLFAKYEWDVDTGDCAGGLLYKDHTGPTLNTPTLAYPLSLVNGPHSIFFKVFADNATESACVQRDITIVSQCSDGIDNDDGVNEEPESWFDDGIDGLGEDLDLADPACYEPLVDITDAPVYNSSNPLESANPQCSDGIDNDGDGLVDSNDGGCHSDWDSDDGDSTYVKFWNRENTCNVTTTEPRFCDPGESFGSCPVDCSDQYKYFEF
ncbi:MAG: hypothetical protein KAR24_03470, partial [Candidatus Pacebacteria bacterium]|nr:hypothetical protein [Candidatus Paceibacterota bacterium]